MSQKDTLHKRRKALKTETYHHGDLRSALIDAAIQLLQKMSPDQLSLRELARQAGVSVAAPYRHFKDKNELLAAISEQGYGLKYKYMSEGIRSAKGDAREMLYACGLAYFRMGLKHPQHFKLMSSSSIIPDERYPQLMQTACKTFMLLKSMIEHLQSKKLLGPGNPYHHAMNCWCVVNGFTALYAEGRLTWLGVKPTNADAALRTLLEQYIRGTAVALPKDSFTPFSPDNADQEKIAFMQSVDQAVTNEFQAMIR